MSCEPLRSRAHAAGNEHLELILRKGHTGYSKHVEPRAMNFLATVMVKAVPTKRRKAAETGQHETGQRGRTKSSVPREVTE